MKLGPDKFSGEVPTIDAHLLGNNNAQIASNVNLVKGGLRAIKASLRTATLNLTTINSLQIFEENSNSHWVESGNDLDYARSPIAGDLYERLYFTGETEPRFFANDNISSPFDSTVDFIKLGILQPAAAPTVGSSGGGSEYKAYIYTYVSSYGDEGPPSLSGEITDYLSGNVTIEDIEAAPTGRAIGKIYLYRTNTSGAGTAEFQFVLEATWFDTTVSYVVGDFVIYLTDLYKCTINHSGAWNPANFTAGDDVADANLGEVISSYWVKGGVIYSYDPPPATMIGLISLPNGVFVGFDGNELYLSEPYRPHAYPFAYKKSFDHQIVALGSFGTTIVVLTDGYPFFIYGSHPASMARQKISAFYPCLFKRSVVSEKNAVFYSSKEGRIKVNQDGAINATFEMIDEDSWESLYFSTSAAWHLYGGKHFGFPPGGETGFVIDFENGIIYRLSVAAQAGHVSIGDGKFYIVAADLDAIDENNPPVNIPLCVKEWAGDDTNYLQYTWLSKKYVLNYEVNMGYARILLDGVFYDDTLKFLDLAALNATLFATGDLGGALGINAIGTIRLAGGILHDMEGLNMSADVTFKLYADGVLKFTKTVSETDSIFALPIGYQDRRYEISLSGYVPAMQANIAPTAEELLS